MQLTLGDKMGLFRFSKSKIRHAKSHKGAANDSAPRSCLSDVEIPIGPIELKVEGLAWSRLALPDNPDRIFSLTPRNHYQEDHEWPEVGCVNVNRAGSRRTTDKNWVGYIPAAKAKRILQVVMKHGTTRVHARVNDGKVFLMLPKKYV